MTISDQIYEIVRAVPKGKVTTYGKIARMVGVGPRQVGRILHNNPLPPEPHPGPPLVKGREKHLVTPCHRVVMADGSLAPGYAFGGLNEQRKRLEKEGVGFVGEKVRRECFI